MNNSCPDCGAVYAVAAKDIGRKLKCKKCGAALLVTDAGLVLDEPVAAAPAAIDDDLDADDEVVVVAKGKKGKKDRVRGAGPGFGEMLAKIGGVPTILFSIGVLLVIWFTFMPKIGEAATERARAMSLKLLAEQSARMNEKLPKGKTELTMSDDERKKYLEDAKKIQEEYAPKMKEAEEDARMTQINNVRSLWFDRYGSMFGFILVAFGCIAYLRTEQPLVMRIVAAVILTFMMIVVFSSFGGCGGDRTPSLPSMGGGGGLEGGMGMPGGGMGGVKGKGMP